MCVILRRVRARGRRVSAVSRVHNVCRELPLFFFLASFCNESLSSWSGRLFSQKKTGEWEKKKGKEEPSKCESIRSIDSFFFFFFFFCLAFAKNPKLPPTSFLSFVS